MYSYLLSMNKLSAIIDKYLATDCFIFLLIFTLFRIICQNVEFEYLFVAFMFMCCVGQAY